MNRTCDGADRHLPLSFEQNNCQADPSIHYLAHGRGYTAFLGANALAVALVPLTPTTALTTDTSLYSTQSLPVVRFHLDDANASATVTSNDPLSAVVNDLVGNDPSHWHTNIPTFGHVTYQSVYPGVDRVYHSPQNELAFDFTVQPGTSVPQIRLYADGVDCITQDAQGELTLTTGGVAPQAAIPAAYPRVAGQQQPVSAHFQVLGGNENRLGSRDLTNYC